MDNEVKNKITDYIQLSAELCSDLKAENENLLQEKESLEQQVEQNKEADETPVLDENQVKEVVNKLVKSGNLFEHEQKEAEENIVKDPNMLLKLVDKMADQKAGSDSQFGVVESEATDVGTSGQKPQKKSDEYFIERFG